MRRVLAVIMLLTRMCDFTACSCEATVESVHFTGGVSAELMNQFAGTLRSHMQQLLDAGISILQVYCSA